MFFQAWYIRGEVLNGYFIIDEQNQELYLINNYESVFFGRFSGASETNRIYLEKFSLKSLERHYERKLVKSSGRFLKSDIGKIIGINNNYLYYGFGDRFLRVIDLKTGKKIAGKKDILEKNHDFINFLVSECRYSSSLEKLLIKTSKDYYALDPVTLVLSKTDQKPETRENDIELPMLKDIATTEFYKLNFSGLAYSDFYSTGDLEFHYSEEPGTVRMFLDFSYKGLQGAVPRGEKKSFLYPNIIGYHNDDYYCVYVDTPSIIVAHTPELDAPAREINISLVQKGSKVLWSKKVGDLFIKPKYGKESKLSYFELEDSILFILQTGKPHRISMSVVDKETGKILQGPVRSINRRFLKA
ncbi:MAG: hypothetical protein C0592_13610 [Marinilabiliales bacterium]|nr:MAG: hypothetical protein C0592_13610 [Marinilabiliales bacterium]